jgi:hypothetical protein
MVEDCGCLMCYSLLATKRQPWVHHVAGIVSVTVSSYAPLAVCTTDSRGRMSMSGVGSCCVTWLLATWAATVCGRAVWHSAGHGQRPFAADCLHRRAQRQGAHAAYHQGMFAWRGALGRSSRKIWVMCYGDKQVSPSPCSLQICKVMNALDNEPGMYSFSRCVSVFWQQRSLRSCDC